MCRLILAEGVLPAKIWNYGNDLVAQTVNEPTCHTDWSFHVAVTLLVQDPGQAQAQPMVLDPSLFQAPVSVQEWQQVQGEPDSVLIPTSYTLFEPPQPQQIETDPTFTKTAAALTIYRAKLRMRAKDTPGSPPYAKCLVAKVQA
jgi:hypothetical protein